MNKLEPFYENSSFLVHDDELRLHGRHNTEISNLLIKNDNLRTRRSTRMPGVNLGEGETPFLNQNMKK